MFGIFKKATIEQMEAYGLLGLNLNARRDEVVAAHRAKMRKYHPDLGGNQALAAQINWARDVLVKG